LSLLLLDRRSSSRCVRWVDMKKVDMKEGEVGMTGQRSLLACLPACLSSVSVCVPLTTGLRTCHVCVYPQQGSWLKPGAVVIDVGTNPVDDPSKKAGYR
jgi:hypothetical protein